MVAASLPRYLPGRSRTLAAALIAVALFAALFLLAYAVFASGLTTDLSPDGQLIGPFRWLDMGQDIG